MKPLTREWTAKAEAEYASALRELRARKAPNHDAACFHAQQCAEKYMKALLQEAGIFFPKTHALELLLDLLKSAHPLLEPLRAQLRTLSALAVQIRYPGLFVDKSLAKEAVEICQEVRNLARQALKLKK